MLLTKRKIELVRLVKFAKFICAYRMEETTLRNTISKCFFPKIFFYSSENLFFQCICLCSPTIAFFTVFAYSVLGLLFLGYLLFQQAWQNIFKAEKRLNLDDRGATQVDGAELPIN